MQIIQPIKQGIDVAIIEDDSAMAHTIAQWLSLESYIQTRIFASGEEALQGFFEHPPEIVLMDIGLPAMSGIECTRAILDDYPEAKILIMSAIDKHVTIIEALSAGAKGYVNKARCLEHLLPALRNITQGDSYLSPDIASTVISHIQIWNQGNQDPRQNTRHAVPATEDGQNIHDLQIDEIIREQLTQREIAILQKIYYSYTYEQIGILCSISPHTVRTHVRNVFKKLGVSSKHEVLMIVFGEKHTQA